MERDCFHPKVGGRFIKRHGIGTSPILPILPFQIGAQKVAWVIIYWAFSGFTTHKNWLGSMSTWMPIPSWYLLVIPKLYASKQFRMVATCLKFTPETWHPNRPLDPQGEGNSPLHFAASAGCTELVLELLKHEAPGPRWIVDPWFWIMDSMGIFRRENHNQRTTGTRFCIHRCFLYDLWFEMPKYR